MFRNEVDTFEQKIPTSNEAPVVWRAGDGPISTSLTDLTTDPKATDEDSTLDGIQSITDSSASSD